MILAEIRVGEVGWKLNQRSEIVYRLANYRWSSYKVYAYGDKAHEWLLS
jgi:hypothetical protein